MKKELQGLKEDYEEYICYGTGVLARHEDDFTSNPLVGYIFG